jgi:signal transduction histidine kinase/CheY-like chemotaxis protein/sugar lactone lactonase YvrE
MKLLRLCTLVATLLLGASQSGAQGVITFYSDNGLSNTRIRSLYEDSRGNVWISTTRGLHRYDGSKIVIYGSQAEAPYALGNDFITCMVEAGDGQILVGQPNMLQLLNFDTGIVSDVPCLETNGDTCSVYMTSAVKRANGDIYLGTTNIGMLKLERQTSSKDGQASYVAKRSQLLPNRMNKVTQMMEDNRHRFWVYTGYQFLVFAENGRKPLFTIPLESVNGNAIQTSEGQIFVGTNTHGLMQFDEVGKRFHPVKQAPASLNVFRISPTPDGRVMICTDGSGLLIYDPHTGEISESEIKTTDYKLSTCNVKDAIVDSRGNTWVGIYWKGVVIKPRRTSDFQYFGRRSALHNSIGTNCVTSMLEDVDGSLWVATDNCGLYHVTADGAFLSHTRSTPGAEVTLNTRMPATIIGLMRDTQGQLWLGGYLAPALRMNPRTGELTPLSPIVEGGGAVETVNTFCQDYSGVIWMGTNGDGLYSYHPKENKLRHVGTRTQGKGSSVVLSNNYINHLMEKDGRIYISTADGMDIVENSGNGHIRVLGHRLLHQHISQTVFDRTGNLWAATRQGMVMYTPQQLDGMEDPKPALTLGAAEGMPDNHVCAIEIDAQENIWASTLNGLVCYNPETKELRTFGVNDGLQGNEFNTHASTSSRGNLFFGGINGVSYFDPQQILQSNQQKQLSLRLVDLYLNNLRVLAGKKSGSYTIYEGWFDRVDEINLCNDDRTFSIELSTMELGMQHITYQYRINNGEWTNLMPGTNTAFFSNMPTGRNHLEFRALSEDATSEVRSITVRIHPAWYASTWAWLIWILLLLLAALYVWKQAQDRIKARRILLKHKKEHELNETRTQFFMNISHEIRTPMTLILSPLERLMRTDTEPERQHSYTLIHQNANRILQLVNQLLDVRKIDKGLFRLAICRTDMVAFLQNLYDLFAPNAIPRNISFTFHHDGIRQLLADIDPQNLDKVIMNLLSNAFKFTPDGGTIDIKLQQAENGETFSIIVSDSGVGIPAEERAHVFDRFFSSSHKSNYVGTGIGLNLAQQLIQLHHGRIHVEEGPNGHGSVFIIHLPFHQPESTGAEAGAIHLKADAAHMQEDNATAAAVESTELKINDSASLGTTVTAAARRRRILIVDDDPQIREYLQSELQAQYATALCSNGQEAWKLVQQNPDSFDLIVTDMMMPIMDGEALCQQVKSSLTTNHIPIVMLTARVDDRDRIEAIQLGADAYLTKPFNIDVLTATIETLLRTRHVLRGKFRTEADIERQVDDIQLVSADERLIERVLKVINGNISNPDMNIEFIADKVGISRVHFHRKLKELTGMTPRDYLKQIRMRQAVHLLEAKHLDITDVSISTGFKSASTFSSSFKSVYGMTPSEYMRKHAISKSNKE